MRLTIVKVKEAYEKFDCILKETEYTGDSIPMKFICSCGKEGNKTYSAFRKTPRCGKCKNKVISDVMERKDYTYEEIEEYFPRRFDLSFCQCR